MPASRSSPITRWRVMPARNVPFGIGVNTTPSLAMNTLELASSATLPSTSRTTQLSKPRDFASNMRARIVRIEAAGLGVDRQRSCVGRRNGDSVIEKPSGLRIGAS